MNRQKTKLFFGKLMTLVVATTTAAIAVDLPGLTPIDTCDSVIQF